MKNHDYRLHTQRKNNQSQSSDFASTPEPGMFESRPFIVQQKQQENSQQPDLKTRLMRAEKYGHHLERIKPAGNSTSHELTNVVQPKGGAVQRSLFTTMQDAAESVNYGSNSVTPSRLQATNAQNHLVQPIQAKLTIGEAGDKYEQEADRVASQVVQQINIPSAALSNQGQSVQRQEGEEEEIQAKSSISSLQMSPISTQVQMEAMPEEEDELQMSPISTQVQREAMPEEEDELQMSPISTQVQMEAMPEKDEELQAKSILQGRDARLGGEASTDVESAINSARGGGQSLDAGLQQSMEQAMGADFSGVKVHTDSQAHQLNQSVQARAFTTGQDVFFRSGEYNPGSRGGQELIAHELTHVMQQRGGEVQPTRVINKMVSVKDDLEYEADDIGNRAVEWRDKSIETLQQSSGVNASVQRKIDKKGEEGLNEFKKMKFYTQLTPQYKSLFEAYLRRSENWALGVFLGNIEVNVDNPRQIVEESREDRSESEGEQQEEITNEDMAKTFGKANPEKESQPKAVYSARVAKPVIVPTTSDYKDRVNKAAKSVVNEIKLKLEGKGDAYGSIDITDGWADYQLMRKKKKDYHNDIVDQVKLTYPQSKDNSEPYDNWVYKQDRASNFTRKDKKGQDRKAEFNIHLNF